VRAAGLGGSSGQFLVEGVRQQEVWALSLQYL
jgi:hypothetical protein